MEKIALNFIFHLLKEKVIKPHLNYPVPSDSKETELGRSNHEAFPSSGENTHSVLVPCCACQCVPKAISGGVDVSEFPGCHFLWQMTSQ